jgi:hypothetical protein
MTLLRNALATIVSFAAVAVLVGAAPSSSPMANFVRAVLPSASNNFVPLRGAKIDNIPDTVYAGYKLRVAPDVCSDCSMYDIYGRGKRAEYWDTSNIYTEDPSGSGDLVQPSFSSTPAAAAQASPPTPPPEWSIQKTESYVKSQLVPLLRGFTLRRTTTTGLAAVQTPTLIWRNAHNVWVEAKLYPRMVAGFLKVGLYVGHDLTRSAHVLRPATKAQLAQMQSATAQLIRTAIPAAPAAFSTLRGSLKSEDVAGNDYRVTVDFGSAFRSCEILNIAARMGQSYSKGSPSWALLCTTIPTLGNRTSQESLIRAAIGKALPAGFTSAADAKAHGYDYLWNSSNGVSVAIDWGDPQDDLVTFTVRIMYASEK